MEVAVRMAIISLVLCFFNLLPIPPLDGSHVLKNLVGMRDETYFRLCQFGFLAVILAIQIPAIRGFLRVATWTTVDTLAWVVGLA
jgi:Zn-dependent protease